MRKWNRREFTRNTAMLTLFSPFISMLEPSVAKAQAGAGPAKYLLIMVTNGTDPGRWQPSGGMFSDMTEPLSAIQGDVITMNQFDSFGSAGNHGSIGALTGTGQYSQRVLSLNFFVEEDLRRRGIITQVPSLHLGGVAGQSGIGFRNNGLQIPQYSLSEAFRTIFDGTAPPPPPPQQAPNDPAPVTATGPTEAEIRLLRRQSVLDRVVSDLNLLHGSLGSLEREKLELHADSIRRLEERLGQQLALARGERPEPPQGGGGGGVEEPSVSFVTPSANCQRPGNLQEGLQDIENSRVHMDLAVTAFQCDLTRVALVEFGHHQSTNVNIPGAQGDWHNDFMHASSDRTRLVNLERWLSDRFVETVNQLKQTPAPDGNGSLYSQTYILWAREMGDAVVHAGNNMPFVVSGGAGGYLRNGGTYIQGGGAAHQQVLLSAAEAMGVTDFSNFGNTGQQQVAFAGLRR